MQRELRIALFARVTWLVAAVTALLVGHGFVLAVDLFSASSRSALASALQAKEMDPLAGIVRPTLGGIGVAVSLFAPLVAARVLSIEKERRTFGALCLLEGSTTSVVVQKLLAAGGAGVALLVSPMVLFFAYALLGGHVDAIETGVALGGEVLHVVLITTISIAAAAWTSTFAQATTIGILASLSSWAIDAADGFAALAWLGGASAWSIERRLEPFQRGIVSVGSLAWLATASVAAMLLAVVGALYGVSSRRRAGLAAAIVLATSVLLPSAGRIQRGYDWTEERRASLPPRVVHALRALPAPIRIDVYLDRDDSRRRQMESDVLAKLLLARPDLVVRTPLDEITDVAEAKRGDDYGRIVIRVGGSQKVTRSTSRREIATLIFETAGVALPEWTSPTYSGFPLVIEGRRRTLLIGLSYFLLPAALIAVGHLLTRRTYSR